jgi:hypothetical protein
MGCHDAMCASWERFLAFDIAGRIQRHNAKPLEERTQPGVCEEHFRVETDANRQLAGALASIRHRLKLLMS